MKADLIIANPPYGKIGANITKHIIDVVAFDEYVNLLPANDYKRNSERDLFNYQTNMVSVSKGFKDAVVTTHVSKIFNVKVNNLTVDEFERSTYIDPSLDKYFAITIARKHYAIDSAMYKPTLEAFKTITVEQSIYIGKRDVKSEHLPYSQDSIVTRYNLNKITKQEVLNESAKSEQALGRVGDFYLIKFSTNIEKTNFSKFIYSKDGFRFLCKVFVALNVDSSISMSKFMPKVDWTIPWTIEEILADYGYTEDEVKEVIADLDNFNGIED